MNTQLATKPNAIDVSNALNLKADTSYVNNQLDTKLNITGGNYSTSFNTVILNGSTVPDNPLNTVDPSLRTNTYIHFTEAGASSDWAYLRQVGDSNDIKLALDFFDNGTDGTFILRSVNSIAEPDTSSIFFSSSPTTTYLTGNFGIGTNTPSQKLEVNGNAIVGGTLGIGTVTPSASLDVNGNIKCQNITRSLYNSGEHVQTKVFSYYLTGISGQLTLGSGAINQWPSSYTSGIPFTRKLNNSFVTIDVDAFYGISNFGDDTFSVQIFVNDGTDKLIYTKSQVWNNQSGGGTRSGPVFPLNAVFGGGGDNILATSVFIKIVLINSTNDTVTMTNNYTVKISEFR